jgi:FkbM family methyltransferase
MSRSAVGMMTSPSQPLRLPATLRMLQRREFRRKLGMCERLYGAKLARHGIAWVQTAHGPIWKLDLANFTHRWLVYGWYQGPALWRWLQQLSNAPRTIVDSGANIGQTVLNFAALFPGSRILAYEPGGLARDWLTESVAAAGLTQVTIEARAFGSAPGTAFLAAPDDGPIHGAGNSVNQAHGEPITLVTLDDELERHRIEQLDFWKLDMEGYELEALRGAERALSGYRVKALYVEIGGETGPEALALLKTHGYTVHDLTPDGQPIVRDSYQAFDNALCLAPDSANRPERKSPPVA